MTGMTLEQLRERAVAVKTTVDQWDDADRDLAYAYLHRAYGMRISDCERALARALLGKDRNRGARP